MLRWVLRRGVNLRRGPLHLQISVQVAAGLVLIFLSLGFLGFYVVREAVDETLNNRLAMARLAASSLDTGLQDELDQLEARARLLAPVLSGEQAPALSGASRSLAPDILGTALLDADGRLRWEQGRGEELPAILAGTPLWAGALGGESRTSASLLRLAGDQAAVVLAVPVGTQGAPAGVLAEALDPVRGQFAELLRQATRIGATGHGELVGADRRVIVAAEPGRIFRLGEHPDLYAQALNDGRTEVEVGTEYLNGQSTGIRHIMAVVPLKESPWVLAIGGTEAEMLAPERQWTRLLVTAGPILLILALGLVWVTTRSVTMPVSQLTAATQRFAEGDLDSGVPVDAPAEVGQLARSFGEMRGRLARALNDLRVEKSQDEAVFRSMADALFTVDDQYRIVTFNPAVERMTGLSATAVSGRHCCEVLQSEDHAGECALCPFTLPEGGGAELPHIEHFRTPGGVRLSVLMTRSPIVDEGGNVVGVAHVLHDMSSREELERLRDEFLSTVSHELKTPLGVIKGYATTLLREDAGVDARTRLRFLKLIDGSSDELKSLIDDLLDMSRIGGRALHLEMARVDLAVLARRTVARARGREYRFSLSFPRGFPPVMGDAQRLGQVLNNLVGNAMKYSPVGSQISVYGEEAGDTVRVTVADEGIGLSPQELEAVFARFYRSPDAARRGIGGTGLGLAICRGIIEAHGGQIWAANRPVGGSLFTFALPRTAEAGEEAGA